MQIRTESPPFGVGFERTILVFSQAERAALRRASEIAARARDLAQEYVGVIEWEPDGQDLVLAHVEHDALELANEGLVVLKDRLVTAG